MGPEDFHKSLVSLARAVKKNPQMSEGEVYQCLTESGFFMNLGYVATGIDIRVQKRGEEGKIPDYECLDELEQSVFVMEVKTPKDEKTNPLISYLETQLKGYVNLKKSRYGVLTNGIKFLFYKREDGRLVPELEVDDLDGVTTEVAAKIHGCLKKPSYEFTDLKQIAYQLAHIEPKSLTEEANRAAFYETFRLREESAGMPTKFTKLVYSLMDLFDELMKEESKSEFLEGAYKFWKKSYAHKPSKVPKSWKNLRRFKGKKIDEEVLYRFMFCLETAHNIVAKLILAKVCEDMKFWDVKMTTLLSRYLETEFLGETRINTIAYPFALKSVLERMRDNLVENVFEEDIFDWWMDCKQIVGESARDWRRKESYVVVNFGLALAKVFFALKSFDFYGVKEDILGELYQHYFDPETRKALGEFYTPIEVVEYILDAVDYNERKILNRRLLDPACGSGTFVVEALKRYLREAELLEKKEQRDYWAVKLRDLCERPKIIGFDINPFAVLMAQIRFMMELVPYYKRAKEGKPGFTLTTIPIFRTDSLEIETKTGMLQRTLDNTISFSMRLPIVEEEEFLSIDFSIPSWEPLKRYLRGDMDNYFILLKLTFDVIKDKARKEHYKVLTRDLADEYQKRFDEAPTLAGYLQPHAQEILSRIQELREKYKDGRLIKSLEDLVLAGILKNFFLYDYVVGNPPYVSIHKIDREKRERYISLYTSAVGRFDLYVLFMERGIEWLNDDGKFSFITSNKFINSAYGSGIRKIVSQEAKLYQLIDFGDTGVFKDATNYPCIFVLTKSKSEVDVLNYGRIIKPHENVIEYIKQHLFDKTYYDKFGEFFEVAPSIINDKPWNFVSETKSSIIKKLERAKTHDLRGISKKISKGIDPGGATDIFVIDSKIIKKFELEKELLKPIVKGSEIKRWSILWHGNYIIYPYQESNGKSALLSLDEYPNTKKYLEIYKKQLENRDYVKNARKRWYELWNERNPRLFENVKILTPDISKISNFVLDENGEYYFSDLVFTIILKNEYQSLYKLVLGLLNSQPLEFYFKHISPFVSGGYYRFKTQYLERLPIKLPQTSEEQKLAGEITSLVDQILALAKVEQRVQNFPEPYFEELKDEIEEYDLVKWQAKRSYKELEPVLEPEITGGSRIVLGKDDFIAETEIDSEHKERYVIKTLKGGKARKGEEFKIKVPRSDAIVKKILGRYEDDKERLRKKSIVDLEKEINERVYKLYGFGEEDKKVIEEFLGRF